MPAIETHQLTHHFQKGAPVVDALDLSVPQGSIYGFLGQNGAGKTTTLKLLLGLLQAQTGEIQLLGLPLRANRLQLLRRVGALIETPSCYGHLTATENLRVLQHIYQTPASRVAEVLELTGLANTGNKKARQFSLGMKQRLGIAAALLHGPELLILDEPTNGLDPNGMLDIRELLLRLNREHGTTILISSHLLAEIEKLVTHAGILHNGKLLFQGTLPDLHQRREASTPVVLETSNNERAQHLLAASGIVAQVDQHRLLVPSTARTQTAAINRLLVEAGLEVFALHPAPADLESLFLHLTR